MSVAFRRESDEEHKKPRFEIPIPVGPNYVTPTGLAQIADRITSLKVEIGRDTHELRLNEANRELRYWRTRLATALPAPKPAAGQVGIGSRVRFCVNGKVRNMHIVGHDEAEPASDRIAYSSPLGRVLLGAEPGELIEFAGQDDAIEIISVEPGE